MIDVVPFYGWPKNLRLRNGSAELIVTLDSWPRALSYRKRGGVSPRKIHDDQTSATLANAPSGLQG